MSYEVWEISDSLMEICEYFKKAINRIAHDSGHTDSFAIVMLVKTSDEPVSKIASSFDPEATKRILESAIHFCNQQLEQSK